MIRLVPLFIMFLLFGGTAESIDFRGYQLDMSVNELIAKMKQAGEWSERNCAEGRLFCHLSTKIKDVPVEVHFIIEERKVAGIIMNFQPDHYDVLQKAMIEKYGKGKSSNETVQNAMGAKFNNEITLWMLDDGIIQIKKYSNKITEGSIYMNSYESLKRWKEKKDNSPGF